MEFCDSRKRTARKEHQCEVCLKPIPAGMTYVYEVGKIEGDFFTRKLHSACEYELHEFISQLDGDTFFDYSDMRDRWIEEKCSECVYYHPICAPDDSCPPCDPKDCGNRTFYGRCQANDDTCTDLSHRCWCNRYEHRIDLELPE